MSLTSRDVTLEEVARYPLDLTIKQAKVGLFESYKNGTEGIRTAAQFIEDVARMERGNLVRGRLYAPVQDESQVYHFSKGLMIDQINIRPGEVLSAHQTDKGVRFSFGFDSEPNREQKYRARALFDLWKKLANHTLYVQEEYGKVNRLG